MSFVDGARHPEWVLSGDAAYTTSPLGPDTWDAFARLVEVNNGIWGGCWCMGFHPDGFHLREADGGNRAAKERLVRAGEVRQILVFAGADAVGWCQYGSAAQLPNIKNPKAYAQELDSLPDWRIGCVFTDKRHRRAGVARTALAAALTAIRRAGGGLVEAYPEQVEGRKPQPGAFLHTGAETLYEEFGFVRDRRIAKWRWVMRVRLPSL